MNILNQFNLTEQAPGPNYKQFRGFVMWQNEIILTPEWIKEKKFCNNGRDVWVNITDNSIFTYCEGDLTLQVFGDKINFYNGLVSAAEFYASNK